MSTVCVVSYNNNNNIELTRRMNNKRHHNNIIVTGSNNNTSSHAGRYLSNSTTTTNNNSKPSRSMSNGHVSPNGPMKLKDGSINWKTVERIDKGVQDIIETVSFVVVYEYLEQSESWERSSMEGTLFIYSRDQTVLPCSSNAFIILSKLTNENLCVHLDSNTMIHTQCPFVLFRKSSTDKVYGLNFTEDEMCTSIGRDLLRLCQNSKRVLSNKTTEQQSLSTVANKRNQLTPSPSLSDYSGGDSQEEVWSNHDPSIVRQRKENGHKQRQDVNRRVSEPIVITQSKQRRKRDTSPFTTSRPSSKNTCKNTGPTHPPSSTPKSIGRPKETLGSVRLHSNSFDSGNQCTKTLSSSPNPVKKLFHSKTLDEDVTSATPIVLHDLFAIASSQVVTIPTPSRGVYSTPPKRMVSVSELEKHMNSDAAVSRSSTGPKLLHPSAFSNSTPLNTDQSDSNNHPDVNVSPPTPVSVNASPLIGARFPSIPSLVQSPGMRSQPIATMSDQQPMAGQSVTTHSVSTNQIVAVNDSLINTSSTLMSPQVFSSVNRSSSEPTKTDDTTIGLTQPQLQQALIHLIKNDTSFITTLHEAYVDSLKSSTR